MKVLLVEDEEFIRDLFKRQLDLSGFTTDAFANGQDGLAAIAKNAYDLVLLDIMLPDINGLQILQNIRQNPASKGVAVVLLTNLGQDAVIKQGFELGADGYLVKAAYTPDQIVQEVKNIMQKKNAQKPAAPGQPAPAPMATPPPAAGQSTAPAPAFPGQAQPSSQPETPMFPGQAPATTEPTGTPITNPDPMAAQNPMPPAPSPSPNPMSAPQPSVPDPLATTPTPPPPSATDITSTAAAPQAEPASPAVPEVTTSNN